MPCTERRIPPPLETEKKKGGSEHGGQSYDWRDEIGARQELRMNPLMFLFFSMNFKITQSSLIPPFCPKDTNIHANKISELYT